MKKMMFLSQNWYFSVQKALIYYTLNKSHHNSFILLVFSHVANFRYVANFTFLTLPFSFNDFGILEIYSLLLNMAYRLNTHPDNIPLSYRRWLLVAWSADFADDGPTLACQPLLRLDVCIFCRRWANGRFLFKMAASNNRGFGETVKKPLAQHRQPMSDRQMCWFWANIGLTAECYLGNCLSKIMLSTNYTVNIKTGPSCNWTIYCLLKSVCYLSYV